MKSGDFYKDSNLPASMLEVVVKRLWTIEVSLSGRAP